jgi:hypothetical protein
MQASCTSIVLTCALVVGAGHSTSVALPHDDGDGHALCTSAGHHQCQVLVPEEEADGDFRFSGIDCPDRGVIDLLWVYTPAALEQWGSVDVVETRCAEAVADANLTFANTLLPFRVRTVGIHGTEYVEQDDYLGHITNPSDGYMDEVHAIRDEVAADIVVLVTVVGCGLAYVAPNNPEYGFQQCSVNCWPAAFRHELGHNLGSQHFVSDDYGYYAWSSGHRLVPQGGSEIGTAMGGNNIPHFSNPAVTYGGVPTGVAPGPDAEADNHLAFLATVPMVADFRCSGDCNGNDIDDAAELAAGLTPDCDENGVPDDCQVDHDQDGIIDACDTLPVAIRVPEYCSSIQGALFIAEPGIHEIVVGPGTWPGMLDTSGIGCTIRSAAGPELTTIDAAGSAHAVMVRSGEGPATVIQGFTITGGSGDDYGGGLLVENASPVIKDCIITGNESNFAGGGVRVTSGSPLLEDCLVLGNTSQYGAGVSAYEAAPRFVDCTFRDNTTLAAGEGGGLDSWDSSPDLVNCRFKANVVSGGSGGGLSIYGETGQVPAITSSVFCENIPDDINSDDWDDGGGNRFYDECPDCPADLDGNGRVDGADLSFLLASWAASGGPADITGDGLVDGSDLSTLLGFWGTCP